MFKLLLLLLLSLNLPAAWGEWDEAEVLWDPTEEKVWQILAEDILNAFEEDLHPRDELSEAVEKAIEAGEDLSKFFGKEAMSPAQKNKRIAEAVLLLNKDFVRVKHEIAQEHLLSAFKQYNDENDQKLLLCIQDMKEGIRECIHSQAIDQQEHYLTFRKNQEGHLCVIDLFAARKGGEWVPVREICASKVLKPSFAPYIAKIPGCCFKRLTEQEKIHSYKIKSVLGVRLPPTGGFDDEASLFVSLL